MAWNTDKPTPEYTITLVGDSGVGKTRFVHKFIDSGETSSYGSFSYTTTIGADFKTKLVHVNGDTFRVRIWDTAGQERFRCIVPMFFRNSNAVMLFFDLSDPDDTSIDTWVELVRNITEDVPIFLIGHKSDLMSRAIPIDVILRKMKDLHLIQYIECSAKTGENVNDAIHAVVNYLGKPIEPIECELGKEETRNCLSNCRCQ